jgi:uncharacterized cupin superfamily protein
MPKIDVAALPLATGTNYPPPFDALVCGRERKRLGNAVGLTQFGVNLTRLKPGAASALRHWHHNEDEFVYMLEGEVVLVENEGETVLRPGDAAGFKAGVENGHHLINRSDRDAVYLEVGTRAASEKAEYPDIDCVFERNGQKGIFRRRSGEPYVPEK